MGVAEGVLSESAGLHPGKPAVLAQFQTLVTPVPFLSHELAYNVRCLLDFP